MAANPDFAATVRAHDWPRYIAIQFAPEDKRADLIAIAAFAAEIDRIIRAASDPLPGEIRLQWWREVLSGEREGEARGHPLAVALMDTIRRHGLPPAIFDRFIEAKTFGLYHDLFPDTLSFEAWCGETEGSLLQLSTLCLDPDSARQTADASGHGGIVLAVSQALAEIPRLRARGQCAIPAEILSACGLSRDAFLAGGDPAASANAVLAFAELGLKHFRLFTDAARKLPKSLRPVFLPVFAARHASVRAAKKPGDAAAHGVSASSLRQFLSMARAAIG